MLRSALFRLVRASYRWLLVGLFALGLFLPLVDWRFELDHAAELSENRVAAPAPVWPHGAAEWKALPGALEKYWNDAFGFRRRLIRWQGVVQYELGVSVSPLVVIGRHSWLYYAGDDAFDHYQGLRPFTEAELANWALALEGRRRWLEARGARFLFVVAPDKQSIYPEHIPARFARPGKTQTDQLLPYLRAHTQVEVLDLREPVRAARAQGPVFPRTDTHWSDRGAYAAYAAIIARLRPWYPKMQVRAPTDFAHLPMPRWNGDMALLLPGPYDLMTETGEHWQPLFELSSRELPPAGIAPAISARYGTFEGPAGRELPVAVLFHDSFLLSFDERFPESRVYPSHSFPPPRATFRPRLLLAEQFSRSTFTWQQEFDANLVLREQPTLVIEEVAERLLKLGPQGTVP